MSRRNYGNRPLSVVDARANIYKNVIDGESMIKSQWRNGLHWFAATVQTEMMYKIS